MLSLLKRHIHLLVLLLTIVVVLPFLLNAFCAFPVLDDYGYAMRDAQSGWFSTMIESYLSFSGRYFATLLSRLNPLEFSQSAGWLTFYSIVLLLGLLASVFYAVRSLFGCVLNTKEQFSVSGLFFILYLSLCPSIAEAFYWFSSYTAYTVCSFLLFVFIGLLRNSSIWATVLKIVLAICIVGSNEVTAVLFVFSLFGLYYFRHHPVGKAEKLILFVTAFFFLLVVFDPGNIHRMQAGLTDSPMLWTLVVAPIQTISWLVVWLPAVLLALAAYIYIIGTPIARLPMFDLPILRTAVFVIIVLFLAHVPCTMGLSTVVIGRTADALLVFFIIYSFILFNTIVHRYADEVDSWLRLRASSVALLSTVFAWIFLVVLSLNGNVLTAYLDYFSGDSAQYRHEWEQRVEVARSSSDGEIVYSPLSVRPQTLYIGDLTYQDETNVNYHFAHFFSLDGVRLSSDAVAEPSNFERLKKMIKGIRNKKINDEYMKELKLVEAWDKVFPLSEKVTHRKVTFETQHGFTLAADLYEPKGIDGKLAALAVCGPFGAVKEQSSGLYAMKMAERGFIALAFDPSFTGESSGEPRRTASPDINTEDFMAAVDYLSSLENVDADRIGIIGICGWGGIALNAAAADTRIKATLVSTMYDMTRVSGNGYYDADDSEEARHAAREALSRQRMEDNKAMAGGVIDPLPDEAPQFVKDYHDYYKTSRGYHIRSGNSNDGWRIIGTQSYANARFLYYTNEIRSAVLVMHGEKAHSRYFGEDAFKYMVNGRPEAGIKPNPNPENKELLIVPGATHCDLYDGGTKSMIPWDKLESFFRKNLLQ